MTRSQSRRKCRCCSKFFVLDPRTADRLAQRLFPGGVDLGQIWTDLEQSIDLIAICLSRLIFLSEEHLWTTISLYVDHYRHRHDHQGIENKLIEPPQFLPKVGHIRCQKQLGGMLNYYYREAA
jgi:hypothetical protein